MNKRSSGLSFRLQAALVMLLLGLLLTGCSQPTAVQPAAATQPPPTLAPATDTPAPTSTPEPTATNTPEPTATSTPEPTATPDKKATAAAKETEAAQAVIDHISPDLEAYGFKPEEGHLVWASESGESLKLQATSYLETKYYTLDEVGKIGNFVIQSKVNWETTSGLASCAFIFRAEDDIEQGKQDFFYFVRLQNAPFWDLAFKQFGRFEYSLASDYTRSLNDKNNTTNTVALVVNGINVTPYFNGTKARLIEDTKLKDGVIALAAYQESGTTTCTFSDTWVWAIDK